LGFDSRDRLVIEAGLRPQFGPGHADEGDVDVFDQRKVRGAVKGAQSDDAAEDLGHSELNAGVDDAEVIAVTLDRNSGGGKTARRLNTSTAHMQVGGDVGLRDAE